MRNTLDFKTDFKTVFNLSMKLRLRTRPDQPRKVRVVNHEHASKVVQDTADAGKTHIEPAPNDRQGRTQ